MWSGLYRGVLFKLPYDIVDNELFLEGFECCVFSDMYVFDSHDSRPVMHHGAVYIIAENTMMGTTCSDPALQSSL